MGEHDEVGSHSSAPDHDEGNSLSLEELAEEAASCETEQFQTETTEDISESTAGPSLSNLANSVRKRRPGSNNGVETEQGPTEFNFGETDVDTSAENEEFDVSMDHTIEFDGDESNILLVGPATCEAELHLCEELMAPTPTSVGTNHRRLSIFIDTPVETQLDILRNRREGAEQQPLIDAGRYTSAESVDEYDDRVDVLKVTSPGDLRRIGILTTKVLSELNDDQLSVTVCFHSLSNLIDVVHDNQRVFRFLHILLERIRAAGGHAHFHLDPNSHDEQTVRTFYSLFDTILEFDADGSVSRQ